MDQTLITDCYSVYDSFGSHQQRSLTHLLCQLNDTITKRPELGEQPFFIACKRLIKPEVDVRNNAAERAVQPAVIMRKITGGIRSKADAKTWSILASEMRTAEQQGIDVLATIQTLLMAEWSSRESHGRLTC